MGFFSRFKQGKKRVVVLGIDGVPHTLLTRLMQADYMPNMARLVGEGTLVRYNSTLPCVSSVAWSTYMTGANPGKHGIYGFIDRQPGSYKTFIPTSDHMKAETLWEHLSRQGKRVVVMNVPVTYPPRKVNGVLIGCFLSPNLQKATYPPTLLPKLQELKYRLDADPWSAYEDKSKLLDDLDETLKRRADTMFYLLEHEEWDFFQCHIMETDRLHHFLWAEMETAGSLLGARFYAFYRQLDQVIGTLVAKLDGDTELMVLSDHGFCGLKQEVYVNQWLAQQGWLHFDADPPKSLDHISTQTTAYSLDPGRIYINLQGREPRGSVAPGAQYEALCNEIAQAAMTMADPADGSKIIQAVFRGEELYRGPCAAAAPDLVLHPVDGYDLKGALGKPALTHRGNVLVGMHTYDDASLYVRGHKIKPGTWSIVDAAPTVLALLGLPVPATMDGRPVI